MTDAPSSDTSRLVQFSVNQIVRVQLTKLGRDVMRSNHDRRYGHLPEYSRPPGRKVIEDPEGWSRWKLHELMHEFGEYMTGPLGSLPFETCIVLEVGNVANELKL